MPKTLLTLPAIGFSLVWIRTWFLSCKVKSSIHAKIARKNLDKWVVWRLMYWSIDVKSNLIVDVVKSIKTLDFFGALIFFSQTIQTYGFFSSMNHFMLLSLWMFHKLFIKKIYKQKVLVMSFSEMLDSPSNKALAIFVSFLLTEIPTVMILVSFPYHSRTLKKL